MAFPLKTQAESVESFWTQWKNYIPDNNFWVHLSFSVLHIVIIFVLSRLVLRLVNRAIDRMSTERERNKLSFDVRRTRTIGKLAKNIISYIVNFITLMLVLMEFGLNLMPLLAGAGVVGLAIGFGAQSLIKDVITGFFIIFEDQFAVGDVIQIGTFKGTVEEIGLRVTRVKTWTGEVHIIPNGSIVTVTNFSLHNSKAVIDVSVSYEADLDRAISIIEATAAELCKNNEDIVTDPKVLGVEKIAGAEVVIRVTVDCKPTRQYAISREMNMELKKALEDHGIKTH